MGNLFSSFDPNARILSIRAGYNWLAGLGGLILIPQKFWLRGGQITTSCRLILNLLQTELRAVFGGLIIPGTSLIFLSYFIFILRSNFLGLFPYVFTASRHFVFSLRLSLPLWLGTMLWAVVHQFNRVIAHLVPLGTPVALISVIVIIETVRAVIRPITLAVRLAANIVAGHLLLTLLGGQGCLTLRLTNRLLVLALVLLIILERAVACIQSYVFTVLGSLYLNEVIRVESSKKSI
jgi:F-type H+-transporting ATPase subunit a